MLPQANDVSENPRRQAVLICQFDACLLTYPFTNNSKLEILDLFIGVFYA